MWADYTCIPVQCQIDDGVGPDQEATIRQSYAPITNGAALARRQMRWPRAQRSQRRMIPRSRSPNSAQRSVNSACFKAERMGGFTAFLRQRAHHRQHGRLLTLRQLREQVVGLQQ